MVEQVRPGDEHLRLRHRRELDERRAVELELCVLGVAQANRRSHLEGDPVDEKVDGRPVEAAGVRHRVGDRPEDLGEADISADAGTLGHERFELTALGFGDGTCCSLRGPRPHYLETENRQLGEGLEQQRLIGPWQVARERAVRVEVTDRAAVGVEKGGEQGLDSIPRATKMYLRSPAALHEW